MASTNDIRNIALLGHGGAGKTSLAEAILHKTGTSNRLGSVDDGVADWGLPDTVIVYEVQGSQLIRSNQQTGVALTVADKVSQMQLTEQIDGVRIDLTLQYRDLTRTYTIVAKDP